MMRQKLIALFDPFIFALLGTAALASVLPARGAWVAFFDGLATAGIVLLFFIYGAKLSREAIMSGARNWQLHLAVLATTFVLFPLLGAGIAALPITVGTIATGMLFLTLLPSTVQSSIAFTAMAGGNVAAAICSASFSNLLGMVLTPALVALLMGQVGGAISLGSVETILFQLLLPFVVGHLLRPWIGGFVTRHKYMLSFVDRGSILLIVYSAFGAAVVEGMWHKMSVGDLALIIVLCCLLLAVIMSATWALGRLLGFPREDAIVLLFCGSKKSLATGVPMAGVLFPAALVGPIILPLMLFHQIQLIACAFIARRLAPKPQ